MWRLTHDDIEAIAIGAGILGTGGGGNPYVGKIWMQHLLRQGYHVDIISLDELPDDALTIEAGGMGAPTVGVEKIDSGDELPIGIQAIERYLGRTVDAIRCPEIGGGNSIMPLAAGALTGKPVVDCDAMGRAFPALQMSTLFIAGGACSPAALVDEKGNCIVMDHITDSFVLERFFRDLCVQMGATAILIMGPMYGAEVKRSAVRGTLTLAKEVGEAVLRCRRTKEPLVPAVLGVTDGIPLFTGKLVDVQRKTVAGFARGEMVCEGLGDDRGEWLHIAFQNENLVAWRGTRTSRDRVVACVPDLICLLESETGEPITTEQLRYGLRVTALAIPCTDKFRTEAALKVVGPAAFGYPDVEFHPLPKQAGIGIE